MGTDGARGSVSARHHVVRIVSVLGVTPAGRRTGSGGKNCTSRFVPIFVPTHAFHRGAQCDQRYIRARKYGPLSLWRPHGTARNISGVWPSACRLLVDGRRRYEKSFMLDRFRSNRSSFWQAKKARRVGGRTKGVGSTHNNRFGVASNRCGGCVEHGAHFKAQAPCGEIDAFDSGH